MSVKLGDTVYHVVRDDYAIHEHLIDTTELLQSAEFQLSVEGSPVHDNEADAKTELKNYIETEIAKFESRKRATERHLEYLNNKLRTL